jgi:hypothetical protein
MAGQHGRGTHRVPLPARVERLSSWKFVVIIVWLTLMALIIMGTVLGLARVK